MGGDGLRRPPGRRRCAAPTTPLAIIPAGRGNDYARVLGIPEGPARGGAHRRRGPASACVDVARANGRPYLGIASLGFDSDANRIANDAKLVQGNLVYLYAALRGARGVEARPRSR